MTTNWNTEEEAQTHVPQEQPTDYKTKAHLVLEGSNEHEWGVVKDCRGAINFIPPDAEIVGTWNKYGDGVFWVSLTTSLAALSDKATQLFAELSEKRKEELAAVTSVPKPKGTRTRVPKAEEVEPEPVIDPLYAQLRSRMGR